MKPFSNLLLVAALLWCGSTYAFPKKWMQTKAPISDWTGVASSADGTKLVAVVYGVGIYLSTDSGKKWIQSTNAPGAGWESVASSADGTKLVAVAAGAGGSIYTSTNSGNTWIRQTNTTYGADQDIWTSVASSADGATLVTVGFQVGDIFVSTNFGAYWTEAPGVSLNLRCVASSADGVNLALGVDGGGIYTSTNSGSTWSQTSATNAAWTCIASSADGTKLAACDADGGISTSADAGATWTLTDAPTTNTWYSIACSADGTKLVAVGGGYYPPPGGIFTSVDSGVTWTQAEPPASTWYAVASSADGNKLVAASFNSGWIPSGGIWTSQIKPSPKVSIAPTTGKLALSWTVPSTNFVLQSSSDLSSWTDLTNQPVLNLTNLQNQVILPPPGSNVFYRLKSP